jgi:hypothetical protein
MDVSMMPGRRRAGIRHNAAGLRFALVLLADSATASDTCSIEADEGSGLRLRSRLVGLAGIIRNDHVQ